MMRRRYRHHGLTLVEMMLALAVTALVAGAIAGMMSAVSSGVGTRRDMRSAMIRANLGQMRLGAYVAPARALISVDSDRFVLWLHDQRPGETIHVSEARWFEFDAVSGEMTVKFFRCPDSWTELQKTAEDLPFASTANWWLILADYELRGLIGQQVIMDGLIDVTFGSETTPLTSKILSADLQVDPGAGDPYPVRLTGTIRQHRPPAL